MAGLLVGSTIITVIKYASIPLLFALLRKKPMHFLFYDLICYALNFIIMFATHAALSSGRINDTPYYLWTTVFTIIGHIILFNKGVFKKKNDTKSNNTVSSTVNSTYSTNSAEKQFQPNHVSEPAIRNIPANDSNISTVQINASSSTKEEEELEEEMFSAENEMQIIEILKQYGELVKSGLLTEEEFNRKKEELLWNSRSKATNPKDTTFVSDNASKVSAKPVEHEVNYGVNPKGEKAVYTIKTSETHAQCPICNTIQPIDRHKCMKCGMPFMYDFTYGHMDRDVRERLATMLEYSSTIVQPNDVRKELMKIRNDDNKEIVNKLLFASDKDINLLCRQEALKLKESLES